MKKIVFLMVALTIVLACNSMSVFAGDWVWDDPYVAPKKVTAIAANGELYGINESEGVFILSPSITEAGVGAGPAVISAPRDLTVSPRGTIFTIMDAAVATWDIKTGPTVLAPQPKIPAGTPGVYKRITYGNGGKLYVLYEKGTGEQYILRGYQIYSGAEIKFDPKMFDLSSKGNWLNCRISLPEDEDGDEDMVSARKGYDAKDIDPDSVKITRIEIPIPGSTPIDQVVEIFRAPGSPWSTGHESLQVKFLRYDKDNPSNPQSINVLLASLLPGPGSKKSTYKVKATVMAQLKSGEWFQGTGSFNVTVPKKK